MELQILTTGTITGVLISHPLLKTPRWRNLKAGAFVVFGSSSFIPLLHGVQRYGLTYMLQYSGMKWYLLELTFYGTGVALYAVCLARSPQRVYILLEMRVYVNKLSTVPHSRAFVSRYI
jgi:predicted membrane channel-forming protein YqfA (hemolysin III family)